MENGLVLKKEEEHMDLPPGFRFHPTDEELVTHYLYVKVMESKTFNTRVIGEVDLNKCEPWDLPWRAKMGEEWYFFCVRDRKYPSGLRTNRATDAGYWKATGKDKEVYKGKSLVGMKKTLVFYKGRAPRGENTNWVMHEYRLEGMYSTYNLPKTAKNEWVICRVFNKSSGGKKEYGIGRIGSSSSGEELGSSLLLPPLMDSSFGAVAPKAKHVTCFSNAMEGQKSHDEMVMGYFSSPLFSTLANPSSSNTTTNMVFPSTPYAGTSAGYGLDSSLPDGGASDPVQSLESSGNGNHGCNNFTKQICVAADRSHEMVSVFHDTTTDLNVEISQFFSNHEMGKLSFDGHGGAPPLHDSLWDY